MRISTAEADSDPSFKFRHPRIEDAASIFRIAQESGSLDVNSRYAYLILCAHFRDTCLVATSGNDVVGFVAAYRPPTEPAAVFVWQVAVRVDARRRGLAKSMVLELLSASVSADVEYLQATVTPSNTASMRMFLAVARELDVPCREEPLFAAEHFGGDHHEPEQLLRIGPINQS